MAKISMQASIVEGGYEFTLQRSGLLGGGKVIPSSQWSDDMHGAVSLLRLMEANEAAKSTAPGIFVEHDTIASMSAAEVATLGLPPPCPYHLRLEAKGAIADTNFRVSTKWLHRDVGEVAGLTRQGACLKSVMEEYLILEPLYSLLNEIETLNGLPAARNEKSLDARMAQFNRVKLALSIATGDVNAERYLSNLTIYHATGVGIDGSTENGEERFEPSLFGDVPRLPGAAENDDETPSRQRLLPGEYAETFRNTLFRKQGARSHYAFAEGVYTVLDQSVEAALRVVQRVNLADPSTKAAFRADPRSFLTEEVERSGGSGDVLCGGNILDEARDYGERVLGVKEWSEKQLTFKIPVYRKWFPDERAEVYTIELPGSDQPLVVRPEEVGELRDAIERAAKTPGRSATFNGRSFTVSPELEEVIRGLSGHLCAPDHDNAGKQDKKAKRSRLLVLRVAENEEDLVFNASMRDPGGRLAECDNTAALLTVPKPHQTDGLTWLKHAFLGGLPGVLLADDMGLGKTFQVLAFLHWLRLNRVQAARPFLVVAPKKLLGEWQKEIRTHVGPEGIGRPIFAYDHHLQSLKTANERESAVGRHTLDVDRLAAADWVLTTYETLRDYHFSFGKVRFEVAVYDEAQKLKSMASLINNAAKSQQPDFTILMTGTPIENSVLDLWTLLDVAWPGFLGMSAKEFAKTYGEQADGGKLDELKKKLIEPIAVGSRSCPPVMLRRFKSDVIEGLPSKKERQIREDMPPEQARKYDAVLADMKARRWHPLKALQALRSVCLHPDLRMPCGAQDYEDMIAQSARFRALFRVLEQVREGDQRALIFLDLHRAQSVLRDLIRAGFRMKELPKVINGETSTNQVENIKEEFQAGRGFDVLLLGPRSAGFGLTLTSANHVVHLSRWWNPAVEDQCSDRVYRLGQDKDVTIHVPLAIHPDLGDASFDVVLDGLLSDKRKLSREIVVPTMMTDEDFQRIFSRVSPDSAGAADVLAELDSMDWRAFELWTEQRFKLAGYQTFLTPRSRDRGADVILRPPPGSAARPGICQCKHRSRGEDKSVDETAIYDVLRARDSYQAKYNWLKDPILFAVTNGRFELAAMNLGKERDVMTLDRGQIAGLEPLAEQILAGVRKAA